MPLIEHDEPLQIQDLVEGYDVNVSAWPDDRASMVLDAKRLISLCVGNENHTFDYLMQIEDEEHNEE
jgi:hypothetical protein